MIPTNPPRDPRFHEAPGADPETAPIASGPRRRILFVAEGATLTHFIRPLVLAKALDPNQYEVHFACPPDYEHLVRGLPGPLWPLKTVGSRRFLETLARARPVFDLDTLRSYVRDDRELIDAVSPDLVIGDMRLSLAVSAPLCRTPYMTITNAYWSAYAEQRAVAPQHPITGLLPESISNWLFRPLRPLAFGWHCLPLNRALRQHGLPPVGWDLRATTRAPTTFCMRMHPSSCRHLACRRTTTIWGQFSGRSRAR